MLDGLLGELPEGSFCVKPAAAKSSSTCRDKETHGWRRVAAEGDPALGSNLINRSINRRVPWNAEAAKVLIQSPKGRMSLHNTRFRTTFFFTPPSIESPTRLFVSTSSVAHTSHSLAWCRTSSNGTTRALMSKSLENSTTGALPQPWRRMQMATL